MPSNTFKRADMRYLAAALSTDTTHAGIGAFEMSLGFATEGNKGERANQVVRHIYEQAETDFLLLQMLNWLYVENPYADTTENNATYSQLNRNVLAPRGISITDNGFAFNDGRDVDSLDQGTSADSPPPAVNTESWPSSAEDTGELTNTTAAPRSALDNRKVFVVHGRDTRPVAAVSQFLQFLGLSMMTWSEAVQLTRASQPHTYDIVRAGISHAAAVVVIFSPDELARIKDDFSEPGDPDRQPAGQSRQNVLLEAGMAFVLAPDRTIFLQSARTRPISDIAGFNWVKLDGRWDSRNDFKNRLESANAGVRVGHYDLNDDLAGPFKVTD